MLALMAYLVGWTCLLFVLIGWGFFARRLFHFKNVTLDDCLDSFWLGCACAIFFLQIWHLFFPVNDFSLCVVTALGCLGLLRERRFVVARLTDVWRAMPRYRCYYLSFVFVSLVMFIYAIFPTATHDDGLYYTPTLHWLQSYPIVPGLGNLHGRLAFNMSVFLFQAMLQNLFSPFIIAFKFNSLLFWVFMIQFFAIAPRLFRNNGFLNLRDQFILLSAPFLFFSYTFRFVGGEYSPDFTLLVAGVILSSRVLLFLDNINKPNGNIDSDIFFIVTMAVFGITVKLSFAPLGCFYVFLSLGSWVLYKNRPWTPADTSLCVKAGSLALIGLIPWMVRGVILTGYVAYPLAFGAFPVDWRMPRASLIEMSRGIKAYARDQTGWNQYSYSHRWVIPWLIQILKVWRFEIIAFLIFLGTGLVLLFKRKTTGRNTAVASGPLLGFLFLVFLSCVTWFFVAPNFRFGELNFLIISVATFMLGIRLFPTPSKIIALSLILLSCAVIGLNAVNHTWTFVCASLHNNDFHRELFSECGSLRTRSGLILYTPKRLDKCLDAPLPCTPYPHRNLCLRDVRSMARGFRISPFREDDATVGFWNQ